MSAAIGAFLADHDYHRTSDDAIPWRNVVVTREGAISTFSPELASGASCGEAEHLAGTSSLGGIKTCRIRLKFCVT